ncbi:hypothetical protein KAFR_0G01920 [Kazachstania africana CBS 2517]|uniref:GRIP domain-containing protein n=1 Tax=Kazachstania africana (strain ATCC 22294 / BCRC 22015 / CBS 2517 / CECT 1963 / NBRC 1671 / NRRL Y-8276) TaxID=1071382 RepID=H2AXX6_KAZAF|nr:hypothetical protein KAFR_0G01920 [Kazachstania africana CBS 2517]CCF59226.1 hypothetical protein KAFR_0G01920 [Kazachstania africana CBS 2517]
MGKNKKKGNKKSNAASKEDAIPKDDGASKQVEQEEKEEVMDSISAGSEGTVQENEVSSPVVAAPQEGTNANDTIDTEVTDLRKQIAQLQAELDRAKSEKTVTESDTNRDSSEVASLKEERDEIKSQYDTLLSRLSSMKTVFNKMKEAQQELEITKESLKEYESQNLKLKNKLSNATKDQTELTTTVTTLHKEIENLERDCENMTSKCHQYERQIDEMQSRLQAGDKNHMTLLETLRKDNDMLSAKIQDLTIVLDTSKQNNADLIEEKEESQQTIITLEKHIQTLEEKIKSLETQVEEQSKIDQRELNEKELELKSLRTQLDTTIEKEAKYNEEIDSLKKQVESLKEEMQVKDRLEGETKEQAIQIGKLRHEAIILNEHLKKALGMLKQSSDSESIDKELISNLLISFVSIPRADPKKFEVLELLSSFLNWDEDKKQQAGLINNLERSSTTRSVSRTQSFVSMWTDFLEKESEK